MFQIPIDDFFAADCIDMQTLTTATDADDIF